MANALTRAWRSIFGARKAPALAASNPTIGPHGPPSGTVLDPDYRARHEQHPLVGANVDKVHHALLSAFQGYPSTLQDLYDDMRDRDGKLDSVARTRTLAIQGSEWVLKPPPGLEKDNEAIATAEWLTRKVRSIRDLPQFFGQLGDGILRGYSVNETEWGIDADADYVPLRFHWRHPNRFVFDECFEIRFSETGYGKGPALGDREVFGRDRFVVHMPIAGRAAYPTRRGVLLGTVFPTLTKRYGVRWWMKAAERWGSPRPYLKLPENAGPTQKTEALELVRKLGENWGGVVWGEVELEVVPGSGNINPAVYSELSARADTENAIAVLGQNLTTQVEGGSFAAEQGHELVRQDLKLGDCIEMASTIRDQVLAPIVRYNRPGAPVPTFEFITQRKKKIGVEHINAGVVTVDEVRQDLGLDPLPDGAGKALVQVPAAFGASPGATPDGQYPATLPRPELGKDPPAGTTPGTPEAAPQAGVEPAKQALNGAQIEALKSIVADVAAGLIPRDTGIELILAGFPLSREDAERIMGNVGQGFAPTDEQPAGGAATAPPFRHWLLSETKRRRPAS